MYTAKNTYINGYTQVPKSSTQRGDYLLDATLHHNRFEASDADPASSNLLARNRQLLQVALQ